MVHNNRVYLILADSKRRIKAHRIDAAEQYQELFERYMVTGGISLPIFARYLGESSDFDVHFILNNIIDFISEPLPEEAEEGAPNRRLLPDKTFVIVTYRLKDYEKVLAAIRKAWPDGQLFHLFFIKSTMLQYYTDFEWRLAIENDGDAPSADDLLGINAN